MVLAVTFCLDRARTINKAWIDTFPIEALLGIFTFIIRLAPNLCATNLRISVETFFAEANRIVVVDLALGIGSTVTRAGTQPIDAVG